MWVIPRSLVVTVAVSSHFDIMLTASDGDTSLDNGITAWNIDIIIH